MKVPKVKLPPQYRLPENIGKHKKQQKKHRYRVVNSSIRVKNSDINFDRIINAKSIEIFFKEE